MVDETYKAQLTELWERAHEADPNLFPSYDAFTQWIDQTYNQPGRFFHGPQHLINMTQQGDPAVTPQPAPNDPYIKWAADFYPTWSKEAYNDLFKALETAYAKPVDETERALIKKINLLAALGHDTEYHVDGKWTDDGKAWLESDINAPNGVPASIKPEAQNDPITRMVLEVFGLKAGDKLSPFAGQNEFLSALVIAKKLAAQHEDMETIVGVVASIEASWPFKPHEKYEELQSRLANLPELKEKYSDAKELKRHVDMLTGAATLLANQDVIGFLGGLEPGHEPNFTSVSHSMRDCQLLVTEEGPRKLQQATSPGVGYTAYDLLAPTFKRVRLNELLLKAKSNNLFHGIKIGPDELEQKVEYPPAETIKQLNLTARAEDGISGNCDIVNVAYKARVVALSLVHSLAMMASKGHDDLASMVDGMGNDANWSWLKKNLDTTQVPQIQLAIDVLDNRPAGSVNDTRQSPIATALLNHLPLKTIDALYTAAETQYFPKPNVAPNLEDKEKARAFLNATVNEFANVFKEKRGVPAEAPSNERDKMMARESVGTIVHAISEARWTKGDPRASNAIVRGWMDYKKGERSRA